MWYIILGIEDIATKQKEGETMYKYGLHMRVKDENASQGYRFTGCRNFVNLADAKESARNGAWECDLLDLVEYGKGLIERYWISEIVN